MQKKWNMILLLLATVLLLSGCSLHTVKELYCLPKRSESFANLQSLMDEAMWGLEYSAPLSGKNLQTVQMADLDGDGMDEYLLSAKSGTGDPMKIFIFATKFNGYYLMDRIDCTGAAFDCVEYAQMDGKPGLEIIVGRRIGEKVPKTLSVFTVHDDQIEQVLTTHYTRFLCCDLDSNRRSDLFVLLPGENASDSGLAELYSIRSGVVNRSSQIPMSRPADSIKRIMVNQLNNHVPAVYVASDVDGSSIVTDVFCVHNDILVNVTNDNDYDTSVNTLRNYYVYADDIDSDKTLELPRLIEMQMPEGHSRNELQYLIHWYSLTSRGEVVTKQYTYHNYVGGWYVRLEPQNVSRITVTQQGSSYQFGIWNEDFTELEPLMTIYVLTGQKREEQAVSENRFVLHRTESTVYAASLEVIATEYGMSQQTLIQNFSLIKEEWDSGKT